MRALQDLTSQQLSAINQEMQGLSNRAIASNLGICEATLYIWKAKPQYKSALRAARKSVYEGAMNKLASAADKAVAFIVSSLDQDKPSDKDDVPSLRLKFDVARYALDKVSEYAETEDLANEVAELKAQLEGRSND
jgi:transposase